MQADSLHVTMWCKQSPEGDDQYCEKLRKQQPIQVTLMTIVSDEHVNSTAIVNLPMGV